MSKVHESFKIKDLTVTVPAGTDTASATLDVDGRINDLYIKAPGTGSKYDFEITDGDAFGVHGRASNTGDQSLDVNKITKGTNTFTISGSNTSAAYEIRVRWQSGRFRAGTRDFD